MGCRSDLCTTVHYLWRVQFKMEWDLNISTTPTAPLTPKGQSERERENGMSNNSGIGVEAQYLNPYQICISPYPKY